MVNFILLSNLNFTVVVNLISLLKLSLLLYDYHEVCRLEVRVNQSA
jgi:hypothetical protein